MAADIVLDIAGRAARAKALLDDELLKEAFDVLERTYYEAWLKSRVEDADARERLFMAARVGGLVRDHLTMILNTGKIDAKRAEAEVRRLGDRPTLRQRAGIA